MTAQTTTAPHETTESEHPSTCLLCGQAGPPLLYGHWICDHCKNVVHAEALSQKRRVIKEGGGPISAD